MKLTLRGYVSIIDKYGKVFFTYINDYDDANKLDDTYNKLCKNIVDDGDYRIPYNKKEFWAISGKQSYLYKNLLGRQVNINVKVVKYNFTSKLEDNLGEEIHGYKLNIIDLYPIKEI